MVNMEHSAHRILIVDDEPRIIKTIERVLRAEGYNNLLGLTDGSAVLPAISGSTPSVIILDLLMPGIPGEDLLHTITHDFPWIPVIVITGIDTVETAVRCMKSGAFDFIVKPFDRQRVLASLRHAIGISALQEENRRLRDRMLSGAVNHPELFEPIVTQSPVMLAIFRYVEAISRTAYPVLITGETGTGKELIAFAIHRVSGRSGAFVPVNVAGLDDNLFSDTLFGHVRGGFTGADHSREGLVTRASGGTLFLDEIGDLSSPSQIKLLRLLHESEFSQIGSDVTRHSDARIVVATNQDLVQLQASGQFRKDLYYRLVGHEINVPPLRARCEDIPLLVHHFLDRFSGELQKPKPVQSAELGEWLSVYEFPGNVRELKSMIMDAMSRHLDGPLTLASLRRTANGRPQPSSWESMQRSDPSIRFPDALPTLKEAADALVAEAMSRSNGNQTTAARLLGISQQAISKRLKNSGV